MSCSTPSPLILFFFHCLLLLPSFSYYLPFYSSSSAFILVSCFSICFFSVSLPLLVLALAYSLCLFLLSFFLLHHNFLPLRPLFSFIIVVCSSSSSYPTSSYSPLLHYRHLPLLYYFLSSFSVALPSFSPSLSLRPVAPLSVPYVPFQVPIKRALPYEGCSWTQLGSYMFRGAIIDISCH